MLQFNYGNSIRISTFFGLAYYVAGRIEKLEQKVADLEQSVGEIEDKIEI